MGMVVLFESCFECSTIVELAFRVDEVESLF